MCCDEHIGTPRTSGEGRSGAEPIELIDRQRASALLSAHGLSPKRALGQNFVVDPSTVRRIARISGVAPPDRVVEVGAGLGSLTLGLLETGAHVTAVEVDDRLVSILGQTVAPLGARVIHGDAMDLDWAGLLGDGPWVLVANLPYNIATPLVADVLDGVPVVERMLVMVQREVAERLAAGPGSRTYGAVSVKVAYWAEAKVVGRVPAHVFIPRPRVESALVEIRRRREPAVPGVEPVPLFEIVRAAFGQRRKMLRRSLAGAVSAHQFAEAGVDPQARPEDLGVEDWGRLARAVSG